MSAIKPLPEDNIPQISPFKLGVMLVIVVGAVALGISIQSRRPSRSSGVLGEKSVDLKSIATGEINKVIGSSPDKLVNESQNILKSKASEIGNMANTSVEKITSDAAKNITDYVYRNTIERMIDTLIETLPEERQKKYK